MRSRRDQKPFGYLGCSFCLKYGKFTPAEDSWSRAPSQRLARWQSRAKAPRFQNSFLPLRTRGVQRGYTRFMSWRGSVQCGFSRDETVVQVEH